MYGIGSVIGGFAGFIIGTYFFGGIFFGIIGGMIGSSIGRGLSLNSSRGGRGSQNRTAGADNFFFVSLFSMLGKMAKADGQVSQLEMNTVKQFMVRDLNLDPMLQSQAMIIFNRSLGSPESFEQYAQQFYIRFRNKPQLIELMVDALVRVAYSDNVIHPSEQHLLESVIRIFHLSSYTFESIKNRYASGSSSYQSSGNRGSSYQSSNVSDLNYSILGCSRGSSDSEIKKAYRKKVSEFHPDKIAAKGLPAEFTKFAGDKFREIQEAYEIIKKERKF